MPNDTPKDPNAGPHTYHPVLLRGDELRAILDVLEKAEDDPDPGLDFDYTPLGVGKLKLAQSMTITTNELEA